MAWILLAITTYGFDLIGVAALMPTIRDDLGGDELYGAVFSVFMLGSVVSLVAAGHLSDRFGPVVPAVIAPLLMAVGLAGVAVAPTMEMVVLARGVSGIGGGGVLSTAYVTASRGFPPHLRARVFAIIGSGWALPSLLGPWASDTVEAAWGWRWMFVLMVPAALGAAALATPTVGGLPKPSGDAGRLRSAVPAVVLATSGAVVLVGTSPAAAALGPGRYLAVAVFAVVSMAALRSLMPRGTLTARAGLPAAVASRGLLAMGFMTANSFMPLALVEFLDASVAAAGTSLSIAALAWTLGAFIQVRLSRACVPRTTARLGLVLVCSGMVASAAAIHSELSIWAVYAAWTVASTGMGLAYNTLSVFAMNIAPAGREGRTAASLQLADPIGAALGAGVGGAVVAAGSFVGLWTMTSAVTAAALITVAGLHQPGGSRSETRSGM